MRVLRDRCKAKWRRCTAYAYLVYCLIATNKQIGDKHVRAYYPHKFCLKEPQTIITNMRNVRKRCSFQIIQHTRTNALHKLIPVQSAVHDDDDDGDVIESRDKVRNTTASYSGDNGSKSLPENIILQVFLISSRKSSASRLTKN